MSEEKKHPGGYKNIDPTGGKRFSSEHQPKPENRNGGRLPSIKNSLRRLLQQEGRVKFDKDQVLAINDDGSVELKLPKADSLAMKLIEWAMGSSGTNSIKAIQMVMEQFDGKPRQTIDTKHTGAVPVTGHNIVTLDELLDKAKEEAIAEKKEENG